MTPAPKRMRKLLAALARAYPDAACTLDYRSPLELLIATILSAQCTDVLVNKVTPALFAKYRRAQDYADAPLAALTQAVGRVNFYRTKAKHIQGACRLIVERFKGRVPDRMEDLLQLPGVARKTANVVLGNAYGTQDGVVVDTHVMRVSRRLGLTAHADPKKIEPDLMALVPRAQWTVFSHRLIVHGRTVCNAKAPQCRDCPLGRALCPSYDPAAPRRTASSK